MRVILLWLQLAALASCVMFSNPVIWEDLADIDLFRVNDTFYYSASSMHFSPGAPVLHSKDLVNWEFLGHSIPKLNFNDSAYSLLDGKRAYARGVWASTLRYRQSNDLWYWIGCVDFVNTYIYTSPNATGPWNQSSVLEGTCFYDCGLLIDDDDTMYVTHGNTNLSVAQLTPDGLNYTKIELVYPSKVYVEGSRMYKRNGTYYIITDQPVNGQYVLKSTSGPFGPYDFGIILNNTNPPAALAGGDTPHQGAIVDTPDGDWYYMAFVDINIDSTGRVPVLAPIHWNDEGWPILQLAANNTWPESLPYPINSGAITANSNTNSSLTAKDTFATGKLSPQWEWNHNPDTLKYSVSIHGVNLSTATVTNDIYQARNTLTHRTLGPYSNATILLDFQNMREGDRAGFALFRDHSAWIGISMDNGVRHLVMRNNMTLNGTHDAQGRAEWDTINLGYTAANVTIKSLNLSTPGKIYLRIVGDFRPKGAGGTLQAHFSWSADGKKYTRVGDTLNMVNDYQFFQAYRYAIFNYATEKLGGSVSLVQFEINTS
jgi:beta-xylosidase